MDFLSPILQHIHSGKIQVLNHIFSQLCDYSQLMCMCQQNDILMTMKGNLCHNSSHLATMSCCTVNAILLLQCNQLYYREDRYMQSQKCQHFCPLQINILLFLAFDHVSVNLVKVTEVVFNNRVLRTHPLAAIL